MRMLKTAVYVASVVFLLAACALHKPIYNVTDVPVASSRPLDANQVRGAIVTAGAALGWKIKDVSPGQLEGTLVLREHTAVVNIAYSATAYSITYKSSINLEEKGGQIHKNYNGWIENLDKGIRNALLTV
jgi:hypothetical protein